jgi:hypothetical protein
VFHYRQWAAFVRRRYVHHHATIVSWLAIFLAGYLSRYLRAFAGWDSFVLPEL